MTLVGYKNRDHRCEYPMHEKPYNWQPLHPWGYVWHCEDCGRHWIVDLWPRVYSGMQNVGLHWRRATRREVRRAKRNAA